MKDFIAKLVGVLIGIIGFVGFVVGLSLLFAFPTKWIANYLFTPGVLYSLFGITSLTVWKAWALNAICGTLFKSTTTKN